MDDGSVDLSDDDEHLVDGDDGVIHNVVVAVSPHHSHLCYNNLQSLAYTDIARSMDDT